MEIEVDISGVLKGLDIKSKAIEQGNKKGIEKAAQYLEAKIAEKVSSGNIPPPLKEATIRAKGSSATLIDTGELLSQITHQVENGGKSAKIGVIGFRAKVAVHHEFGAPAAGIPERSFIRSTKSAEEMRIKRIIKDELERALKT